MIAEQAGDYDGHVTREHLAAAEAAGLVERDEAGVRLSEFGWKVAAGLGEPLRRTLPQLADSVDDVSLQHIAQILTWIAGPRGVSADQLADELGDDRPRIMRELDAAEKAGIIQRADDGGVLLTDRGWDLAGAGV